MNRLEKKQASYLMLDIARRNIRTAIYATTFPRVDIMLAADEPTLNLLLRMRRSRLIEFGVNGWGTAPDGTTARRLQSPRVTDKGKGWWNKQNPKDNLAKATNRHQREILGQ